MRRFQFTLAQVLVFRRRQLEVEESKLEKLLAERASLDAESARLAGEERQTRGSLMVADSAEARELETADLYLRHIVSARKKLAEKGAEWQTRFRDQQSAILEARRRLKLMEKLEEKQFREWSAAAAREQENLASELFLARWNK